MATLCWRIVIHRVGGTPIAGISSADTSSLASCLTKPSLANALKNSVSTSTNHDPSRCRYPTPPSTSIRFLVTRWEGEPFNAAPEEHDDLRWFRPSDLPGLKMAHPTSLSSILSAVEVAAG
jgi:hypothetical protein